MTSRACLAALLLFGCSSSNSPAAPADTGVGDDTGSSDDTSGDVGADVPAEVCGNKVGDTMCDIPLLGYSRFGIDTGLASDGEYKPMKMSEILNQQKTPYAYVYVGAYW